MSIREYNRWRTYDVPHCRINQGSRSDGFRVRSLGTEPLPPPLRRLEDGPDFLPVSEGVGRVGVDRHEDHPVSGGRMSEPYSSGTTGDRRGLGSRKGNVPSPLTLDLVPILSVSNPETGEEYVDIDRVRTKGKGLGTF